MKPKIDFTILALLLCIAVNAQVSVLMQHNDLARTGWNKREAILTPSNVNVRQFGKIFSVAIDDIMFAQVLILSNVNISGSTHNVAIAASTNSTVYAFDANNGNMFWSKNFTPPGLRVVKSTDFAKCAGGENTDVNNVGIIGTPVIDSIRKVVYFVTRATDAGSDGIGNFYTYLHAVDIRTGMEKPNSPTVIEGSVPGSGPDAYNGRVSFTPLHQNQRISLVLYKGIVYVGFSSHCDWRPYHGWIFGYDAVSLKRKLIYNTTPDAMGGGIWISGGGIIIDKNGYMYLVSGNAEDGGIGFNGNPSDLSNRAQSAIKLKITDTALIPVDFFTPSDFKTLDGTADLDYGSLAPLLIPNSKIFVTGCKDGNLYILNTDNLGGFNSSGNQIVQTIPLGQDIFLRCQPAYYGSNKHEFVYIWSQLSQLKAIPFNRGTKSFDVNKIQTSNVTVSPWSANISTSSNDYQDGTGIVWISQPDSFPGVKKVPLILTALDANDVTVELWNSQQDIKRDSAGYFLKFTVPTISNGKVYMANASGHINVYGIIDTVPKRPDCMGSAILSAQKPAFASSFISNKFSPAHVVDQDTSTKWSTSISGVQWIGINLENIDSICNVSLIWDENAYGKNFLLQVSDDSVSWTTIKSVTGNTYSINSINMKASGKYVRVYCKTGNAEKGYSLRELTVYGSLIYGCKTPQGTVVTMIDTSSAIIRWKTTPGASGYSLNFKPQSSSVWQTYQSTYDSFFVSGLSCNTYYQYAVKSKCNKNYSELSPVGDFNTMACPNCLLPTRTFQTDIGNVGMPGQGCYAPPNIYYMNASGADIGANADAFHFIYKDFSGDGSVRGCVVSIQKNDPFNKTGVMIRENLNSNSRFVFLGITSGGTITFLNRAVAGNKAVSISKSGYTTRYYFRIVKKADKYSGYVSPDGVNWTLFGTMQNQMPPQVLYAGLALTSHDSLQLSNAMFRSLSVSSSGAGFTNSAVNANSVKFPDGIVPEQNLKVYPNPAGKNFRVEFDISRKQDAVLSIIGAGTGNIYFKENLLNFSGHYRKQLTRADIPKGSYLVMLKCNDFTRVVTLIVQ